MSPFSPYGPTIALVFVLLVAAIKAIIEDKKRHQEDRITNNSIAHVVQPDGTALPGTLEMDDHGTSSSGLWEHPGVIRATDTRDMPS